MNMLLKVILVITKKKPCQDKQECRRTNLRVPMFENKHVSSEMVLTSNVNVK